MSGKSVAKLLLYAKAVIFTSFSTHQQYCFTCTIPVLTAIHIILAEWPIEIQTGLISVILQTAVAQMYYFD